MRASGLLRVAALVAALALAACASPTGIREVDARDVHRTLTSNVLSTGELSVPTRQVLLRLGLWDLFQENPPSSAAALHALPVTDSRLFALAELSFWLGEHTGERGRYLASAVYAWAFLFPGVEGAPPEPTDPRFRLACDLYNRGLTEGVSREVLSAAAWSGERVQTPLGEISVAFDRSELVWSGWELGDFLPAAYFEVRGLRNRYRWPGLGAPLVASLAEPVGGAEAERQRAHLPPRLKVPVTALLRIEDARAGIAAGRVDARLELITQDEAQRVEIEGREVPLELESSSALAYSLEGPPVLWTELRGFFYGGVVPRLTAAPADQVWFLEPYRPGRIPVVLVHGTASSPMRWAELVNELVNDTKLQGRYQFWLYRYDSGNPIGLSAGVFREALRATVHELDPEGRDPALAQLVVIGHSQGGLLTKLAVVESGDRFWRLLSSRPLDEIDLPADQREVLRRSTFFEPLPFVKRVVFVATPHRGSYLTPLRLARWVAGFVQVPNEFTQLMVDVVTSDDEELLIRSLDKQPTAIDNMTPGNPFLRTLLRLNVAPGVSAHSIIAVEGEGPAHEGADGVVRYTSAHLRNVDSTRVVRASHSCQGHPETIEEVRRILREHAGL